MLQHCGHPGLNCIMPPPVSSRYTLVKGRFWIHYPDRPRSGPEPDGDTVRFEPAQPSIVSALPRHSGVGPSFNARGLIAVRYEGIDALETHFAEAHQKLAFANAGRDENLRMLGFTGVEFFSDLPNKVRAVAAHPLDGSVLANGIESNGRLLGLVFPGGTEEADGTNVFVDTQRLEASINMRLVQAGLAYFEPYDTMPMSLVTHGRSLAAIARTSNVGMLGQEDVGVGKAAVIADLARLQELVMWPKLFRRLVSYFSAGNVGLTGFDDWIRDDPVRRDDTLRLPDGEKANMHDTYGIDGNSLSLTYNPEQLLIEPDPA